MTTTLLQSGTSGKKGLWTLFWTVHAAKSKLFLYSSGLIARKDRLWSRRRRHSGQDNPQRSHDPDPGKRVDVQEERTLGDSVA